jgi:hypothetical protein
LTNLPEETELEAESIDTLPAPHDVGAEDNCGPVELHYDERIVKGACERNVIVYRTWYAEDACGHVSPSFVQVINVGDIEPPVCTNPGDIIISCTEEVPAQDALYAEDDDGTVLLMKPRRDEYTYDCKSQFSIWRSWKVSDECGNYVSCGHWIHVYDDQPPSFGPIPEDESNECGSVGHTDKPDATDECSKARVTMSSEIVNQDRSCDDRYDIVRTFVAEDECGLTASASQTIHVDDTTPPEFNPLKDKEVHCASRLPNLRTPSASDKCSEPNVELVDTTTIYENCEDDFQIAYTYQATDDCGNSALASQTITVVDREDPELRNIPRDVEINCDDDVPDCEPEAYDDCTEDLIVVHEGDETITDGRNSCPNEYRIVRTWSATDNCGKTTTAQRTITVTDKESPRLFNVPYHAKIDCHDDLPEAGSVDVTDNCDEVDIIYTEEIIPGDCDAEYIVLRSWEATDCSGNSANGRSSQTLTVIDNEAPFISGLDEDEEEVDNVSDIPSLEDIENSLTVTDNCDRPTLVCDRKEHNSNKDGCDNIWVTYKCTATDECGNRDSWSKTYKYGDYETPDVPDDEEHSYNCDDRVDAPTYEGGDDETVKMRSSSESFCKHSYTNTYDFTVCDHCGNCDSFTITHIFEDTTPPTLTHPEDETFDCSVDRETPDVSANDDCDTDPRIFKEKSQSTNRNGDETITWCWTVFDDCGNSDEGCTTYTYTDTTPPVIEDPGEDYTYECTGQKIPDTCMPDADDDCQRVKATLTETIKDGECECEYTIIREWTACDDSGNCDTVDLTINVEDTTPPTLNPKPKDIHRVQLDDIPDDGFPKISVSARDKARDDLTHAIVPDSEGSEDIVDGNGDVDEKGNTIIYYIIRTWYVEDDCGNSDSHVQTITVIDTTPPEVPVPFDITVPCDAVPGPEEDTTLITEYSDIEDTIEFEEERNDDYGCENEYQLYRTWTLTDKYGNSADYTQTVTVIDDDAPRWTSDLPQSEVTVEACDVPDPDTLTAIDNCDGDGEEYAVTVSYSQDPSREPTNTNVYTLHRTWTACDMCGHCIEHDQFVFVEDTTDPDFCDATMPADATYECHLPDMDTFPGCDDCYEDVTVRESEKKVNQCPETYTVERTWTVTDAAGNSFTHTQNILSQDTTPPYFIDPPQDYELLCTEKIEAPEINYADDCGSVKVHRDRFITNNRDGSYDLCFEWTITDSCDNSATHNMCISVLDDGTPELSGVCDDEELECDVDSSCDGVTATDDCENVKAQKSQLIIEGTCEDEYTVISTWTATDSAGNSASESRTVSFVDTTAPWFTNLHKLDGQQDLIDCRNIPDAPELKAKDNCDNDVDIQFAEAITYGRDCVHSVAVVRVWTATDNCGNTAEASQTLEATDNDWPYWTTKTPRDNAFRCDESCDAQTLEAEDYCDGAVAVTMTEEETPGTCGQEYLITRVWSACDACGHCIDHTQVAEIYDNVGPKLHGKPADKYVGCEDDAPAARTVTATDDCEGDVEVIFTEETSEPRGCGEKVTTRTWYAVDSCGNSASHTQTITFEDNTKPEIELTHGDLTFECNDIGEPETPEITDSCSDFDWDVSTEIKNQRCTDDYTIVYTWTATDCHGNSAQARSLVHVQDTTPPYFITDPPPDVTVDCYGIPEAEDLEGGDDCSDLHNRDSLWSSVRDRKVMNNDDGYFTIYRTYIIQDNCGNKASHVQAITVWDNTPPELQNVPEDFTVECGEGIPCDYVTATDDCDDEPKVKKTKVIEEGTCEGQYWIHVSFVATDSVGNEHSDSYTITIEDTEPPILQGLPADQELTVDCSELPKEPHVSAVDACSKRSDITIHYDEERVDARDAACEHEYTLYRTWTATDECGNTDSYTQTISVTDHVAPILGKGPGDKDTNCDNVPDPKTLNAKDNCDNAVEVIFSESTELGSCNNQFTVYRKWYAVDSCGNDASEYQTINVNDDTAPRLSPTPHDKNVQCDEVPEAPTVTAKDKCDDDLQIIYTEWTEDYVHEEDFTLIRLWQVSDDCGNSDSVSQTIVVGDYTPPKFEGQTPKEWLEAQVPSIPYSECDELIAYDNCDESVEVTCEEEEIGGNCEYNYWIIRTWHAEDNSGNYRETTQTINVQDTTPPEIHNVPDDYTTDAENAPTTDSYWNVYATDNSGVVLDVTITEEIIPGKSDGEYTIVHTFYAEDDCGNVAQECIRIKIIDTTPPIISGPEDEVVECDEVAAACDIFYDGDDYTVKFKERQQRGDCKHEYHIIRTWTVTDGAGNKAFWYQTVTVQDTTAPVLTRRPEDVTVSCNCDDFPSDPVVMALDNCDEKVRIEHSEIRVEDRGSSEDEYSLIRTWSATDNCGNTVSHTQTVNVVDEEAPVFTHTPADTIAQCDAVPAAYDSNLARDNCDDDVSSSFTETRTEGVCEFDYTLIREWTAQDRTGNAVSHLYVVTVVDSEVPELTDDSDSCLWPQNDLYHTFNLASQRFFDVTDNCGSFSSSIDSCSSSQVASDRTGFSDACYYDEFSDTLYVQASADDDNASGRTYTVSGTVTDQCGNTAQIQRNIWVPFNEASYEDNRQECYEASALNHP